MLYYVKEVVSVVIDDPTPVEVFTSFFDAMDFIDEHPDLDLYVECVNEFTPVITDADIDAYLMAGGPTNEGDPRDGFRDTPYDIARVLRFLGWVAQLKAMDAPQSDPGHFGYETMLYEYHRIAEEIASLW